MFIGASRWRRLPYLGQEVEGVVTQKKAGTAFLAETAGYCRRGNVRRLDDE